MMEKGVEIFQIEPRNLYFHEDKSPAHSKEMLEPSLISFFRSKIRSFHLSQINNQIEKLLLDTTSCSEFNDYDKVSKAEIRKS